MSKIDIKKYVNSETVEKTLKDILYNLENPGYE